MRTARSKVDAYGAAREGTKHFLHQRLSALANIFLFLFLLAFGYKVACAGSYERVLDLVGHPFYATGLILTVLSFGYHMKLGMQTVIEDYVHTPLTRLLALVANAFFCYGGAALGIVSILIAGF